MAITVGRIYSCRMFYGNGTARLVRDSITLSATPADASVLITGPVNSPPVV
jgi:hypothetical protein